MRSIGFVLMCLILGGCAIPLPLSIASFVIGTGSSLSTGKSVPEHLMSFTLEQDCAMWHVLNGERVCKELPAQEVAAIRRQKRRPHRGLLTEIGANEPHEGVRMAWMPELTGGDDETPLLASTRGPTNDQPPAIGGAAAWQMAALSGPAPRRPSFLVSPTQTPPSPVIVAEAAEARRASAAKSRPSGDGDLPRIPILRARSAAGSATPIAGASDGQSGLDEITSMIARTESVGAGTMAGERIDLPLGQKKIDLSGRTDLLTADDPETARRIAAIKRMRGAPTAANPIEVALLQPSLAPVPGVRRPKPIPATFGAGMSRAAGKKLKAIIGQGAPEAGIAQVPAPAGRSDKALTGPSPGNGKSGIDKAKSLFAPKRQTVFGETLVTNDGLPAVPPLAATGKDGDPVVLPPYLAAVAPKLGRAAVAPAAREPSDPRSAYLSADRSAEAPGPIPTDDPIKNLPPITAMVVPSWQPAPDRSVAAAPPMPTDRAESAGKAAVETPDSARYVIIGSFRNRMNAERAAARHQDVAAAVVPAKVGGVTHHRVAVPDRSGVRGRIVESGITDYWILRM